MRIGRTIWVALHWIAAATSLSISLLVIALDAYSGDLSGNGVFGALVGLVSGSVASVLGAILATVIFARAVSYAEFMSATTTSRTITCGWVLAIVAFVFSAALVHGDGFAGAGQTFGSMIDRGDFSSLLGALGVTSLLAQAGFGLTEFRRAHESHGASPQN